MKAIMYQRGIGRRRGLTLVETAVVLTCVVVLLPLCLAAVGAAARPNRERMCAYRLGRLGGVVMQYAIENDGQLPGSPGTSGAVLILKYGMTSPDVLQVPEPLTQIWDWAGPLTGYFNVTLDADMPTRWAQLREGHFWCPSNDYVSMPYYGGHIGPLGGFQPIRMLSYDSVRNFLMYGDSAPIDPALASKARWSAQMGGATGFPDTYRPTLSEVGAASDKVFLADGSRFITQDGVVDHDISLFSTAGGAYADGGPTLADVFLRSYLRTEPLKAYAYRHQHGDTYGINALHFDGHVGWMSEAVSRHPRWWFPSGTTIPYAEMNRDSQLQVRDELVGSTYIVP